MSTSVPWVALDESGAPRSLVAPCSSAESRRPAPRPAYAVLDCRETAARLGLALPPWEKQVRHYVRTAKLAPGGVIGGAA